MNCFHVGIVKQETQFVFGVNTIQVDIDTRQPMGSPKKR
jgi:hypothetical protein